MAGDGGAKGVDFGQEGKRAVRFDYASLEENIESPEVSVGERETGISSAPF